MASYPNMREIKATLLMVNSTGANLFKYPIGNKLLTDKLKELESKGQIKFNAITQLWERA